MIKNKTNKQKNNNWEIKREKEEAKENCWINGDKRNLLQGQGTLKAKMSHELSYSGEVIVDYAVSV